MLSPVREEGHAELLRELLRPIDRRRDELQRHLDELAGRRAVMPPRERTAAREAAVELRDELARLDLVAAVATRLFQPPAPAPSRSAHVAPAGLLTRPPYRNAVVVMAIAVTMVSIFAVSYTLALDRPAPHDIPAAVVGPPAAPARRDRRAGRRHGQRSTPHPYASLARAKHAIGEQRIYAALALTGSRPRLFIAERGRDLDRPRAGQAAQAVPARAGGRCRSLTCNPLAADRPAGSRLVLRDAGRHHSRVRDDVPAAGQRREPAAARLARLHRRPGAGRRAGAGADHRPVLQALPGTVPGAVGGARRRGRRCGAVQLGDAHAHWAVGHHSHMGPVHRDRQCRVRRRCCAATPPSVYRFVGRFLPNGATVETIRNVSTSPIISIWQPILVEVAWITGALVLLLIAALRRRRTPGTG